jgi:hypothetical protein
MEKTYLKDAEKMEIGDSVTYSGVKNIRSVRNACYRLKRDTGMVFKVRMLGEDSVMVIKCA